MVVQAVSTKTERSPTARSVQRIGKVWSKDAAAMMVSTLSTPFDAMNLLANVDTKVELERLNTDLQKL
jgi:hypothetical protein